MNTILKLLTITLALPLWGVYLLSFLSPRNNKVVVFGTHTDSLAGNIKSLLIQPHTDGLQKILISNSSNIEKEAIKLGITHYNTWSLKGILQSLCAQYYVYSNYPSDINFWLSGGAKYINVWHGTPIKKIERDIETGHYSLRNKYQLLFKILAPFLLVKPNVLLVSSPYEEQCFSTAFQLAPNNCFRAFPPRLNELKRIKQHHPIRRLLYAPTWRDDHAFQINNEIDFKSLNQWLQKHELQLEIKLHPSDKQVINSREYTHISIADQNTDIYSRLKTADILITDYSSMAFEAMYINMPVILFCPDIEAYKTNSREFYIDPSIDLGLTTTYSQAQLKEAICELKQNSELCGSPLRQNFQPYQYTENLLQQLMDAV